MKRCELCQMAVETIGKTTQSYVPHREIRKAMNVINYVQELLHSKSETHELSLQLEMALKRLNEYVLNVDDYYEANT